MSDTVSFLGLWENLVTIFGNPIFLVLVLLSMFAYYATRADINKWSMITFFTLFFVWVGYTVHFLFLLIALAGAAILSVELIRRLGK